MGLGIAGVPKGPGCATAAEGGRMLLQDWGRACLAEGAPSQVWGLAWAHMRGSKAPGQAEGGRVGGEGLLVP